MRNGYFNYEKLGSEFAAIDPERQVPTVGEQVVSDQSSFDEYNMGAEIFSTYKNYSVKPKE